MANLWCMMWPSKPDGLAARMGGQVAAVPEVEGHALQRAREWPIGAVAHRGRTREPCAGSRRCAGPPGPGRLRAVEARSRQSARWTRSSCPVHVLVDHEAHPHAALPAAATGPASKSACLRCESRRTRGPGSRSRRSISSAAATCTLGSIAAGRRGRSVPGGVVEDQPRRSSASPRQPHRATPRITGRPGTGGTGRAPMST